MSPSGESSLSLAGVFRLVDFRIFIRLVLLHVVFTGPSFLVGSKIFVVPFLFRMMNDDEFLLDSDMLAKTAGAPFSRIALNSKAFGSQYLHAVGGGHSFGEISWALAHFGVLGVEHIGSFFFNRGTHGPTDFGNVKYQDPSGIYLEASTHIYTIG